MVLHHCGHNLHMHQYLKLGLAKQCPVGFRRNGEVVLRNDRGGLVSWYVDTQMIKDIEIDGFCCTLVGSYVESLVLLDKASNSVVSYCLKIENQ